ncbi:MAG: class I SAM-dependent methyltransferase [Candidatus Aminicenantes bacterium]|nr:class I SAM-dependent methyltransferase [Candidatus Aminicenantes bacterium]
MKLKKRLPKDQNFEQVRKHYEIEKSIAEKLKKATREERKKIFPIMYHELFANVPDHPRLMAKKGADKIQSSNRQKFQLVKEYLNNSIVFVEFGPGDCHFASSVCKYVKKAYAVDISDQREKNSHFPSNFELIIYDGYNLNIERGSVNVVFSDQFIEHLHPEDVEYHFLLVKRILRDGGLYIFRTPHAFFGPHDISKYFSDEPEGFHLKEWTYSEIGEIIKKLNFSSWSGFWRINSKLNKNYKKFPFCYFKTAETILKGMPKNSKRYLSRLFLPLKLSMIAVK